MGEQSQQQQQATNTSTTIATTTAAVATTTSSRLRNNNNNAGIGEIVEVQGGHIVRSTGRKDRHSKVCTAKGPRDRRVRLSAHTAIQFYDVQDRLGYDRPSKAVDWLIKKAKPAIDELAELPAWTPTTVSASTGTRKRGSQQQKQQQEQEQVHQFQQQQQQMSEDAAEFHRFQMMDNVSGAAATSSIHQSKQQQHSNSSSFLPPSLDSDSIADTIKSFFPMGANTDGEGAGNGVGAGAGASTSTIQFHSYAATPDLLSRTSSQSQDLRLSLQSFQEPTMLLHQHHQQPSPTHHQHHNNEQHHQLFSGAAATATHPHGNTPLGFLTDAAGWTTTENHHHNPAEIGRLQRMVVAWNADNGVSSGGGSGGASTLGVGGNGGFIFNSLPQVHPQPLAQPPAPMLQPLFSENQFFTTQRGPLQSSNTPSLRAWIDPAAAAAIASAAESSYHHHHHHHHPFIPPIHHHPAALSSIGFANTGGGFSGFRIPARIQGEEEEHDGIHHKPSSASSDSRH